MQILRRDEFLENNTSGRKIVEISIKIKELLDQMEYKNTEMLLTKEHIKHNLSELILSANSQSDYNFGKKDENYIFANNFLVDHRGKIKVNFS